MKNVGSKFRYADDFKVAYSSKYNFSMIFHLHDDFEIYHSIKGGKFYLIGDMVYDVEPGDMFIINSNEVHKSVAEQNVPYERYLTTFKPNVILNYCTEQTDLLSCFSNSASGQHSHKIHLSKEMEEEFFKLYELIDNCSGYGEDVLKVSYLIQLLVSVNRLYLNAEKTDVKNNNNFKIKPMLDYINLNLTEELNLNILEKYFHLNKYYLCDLFKRYTGTTINKYIITRRIAESKKLLGQGLPVSDVCQMSGFNDYSHFIRTFTKIVGVSPKKYSQSINKNSK